MPVLFVGHGSPMNVIEDSPYRRAWQSLGAQFGVRWAKPKLILCISAHWITQGWWLTGMDQPKTIHDFGGFPQELFEQQYPAPGAPEWAAHTAQQLRQPHSGEPVGVDLTAWGLDHGAWGVLKPMFPAADIPVVQLSMDYHRPPAEHFALGQQLRAFVLHLDRALEERWLGLDMRHAALGICRDAQAQRRERCRLRVEMTDGFECFQADDLQRIDTEIDRRAPCQRCPLFRPRLPENAGQMRFEPFGIIAGDMRRCAVERARCERVALGIRQERRRVALAIA